MGTRYITELDSATAALRAVVNFLHGKELRSGGIAPSLTALSVETIERLPNRLIDAFSSWSGWISASSPSVLDDVDGEAIARWVADQYPKRQYPALAIGSSNGAAVPLCTALGIPWLPQTLLISLRRSVDPDEPKQDVEWGKAQAQRLLANNPELWVYQMHDPNQDRIKIPRVGYFRIKRTRLGNQFKQFMLENLAPGGTIFLLECQYKWLSTQVGDRHVFQFGGKGHLTPEEYFQDSQQIADFLKRHNSNRRQWDPPAPDGDWPESEWGFEPALRQDVEQFARQHGYRLRRIVFSHPQDLSPLVADLYRWWYRERNLSSERLLVESFVYLQPWLALRIGLVPFWTVFNDRTSLDRLKHYLDSAKPYEEININLFSNGINSLGIASIEQWQTVFNRATQRGRFLGVDKQRYPRDLASFIRHYTDLKKLPALYPPPEPLKLEQLDTFLAQWGDRYPVRWLEG